jgi:hypothetical protein
MTGLSYSHSSGHPTKLIYHSISHSTSMPQYQT